MEAATTNQMTTAKQAAPGAIRAALAALLVMALLAGVLAIDTRRAGALERVPANGAAEADRTWVASSTNGFHGFTGREGTSRGRKKAESRPTPPPGLEASKGAPTSSSPIAIGRLGLDGPDLGLKVDKQGQLRSLTPGLASIELPMVGPLKGAFMDRVAGVVGTARGAELGHLGAHLRDDHEYLYFNMGDQPVDLFLDLDFPGAEALPQRISTSGNGPDALFVMDLDGDYFYFSVGCDALAAPGGKAKERPKNKTAKDDTDLSTAADVSLDLTGFDPGGCGIGWSAGGNIPFVPMMTERTTELPQNFAAHLVIDGSVPVHSSATVDGEVFIRFDDDRTTMWANAEVDLALSFAKGAAEVNLPAARGTFGISVGDNNFDLWATATAGSSAADGTNAELLAGLAPIVGQVDLDGELHFVANKIQANSFLQLKGDIAFSKGNPITKAGGVDMDNTLTADAFARIDHTGVEIRGTVDASPISAIKLEGSASLDVKIPFANPANGYFQLEGEFSVGDTALGAKAFLRIDRNGALARGKLTVDGLATLDVEGWLGPKGFQLTGKAEVTLPIGDLDKVAQRLVDKTPKAEQLRLINAQIDERVNEIAAQDPRKGAELRTTLRDLRNAFTTIDGFNRDIAINNRKIAAIKRRIRADIRWHWRLNSWDRFWDKGPHAIRLAALNAEMAPFSAANAWAYSARDTANAALGTATQVAIGVVGWDSQLNALVTMQAEAYWGRLTSAVVATVLEGADAILDAFGVDGSAVGTVTFTVGTKGVAGSVQIRWCRDGKCQTLAGGSVQLAPQFQVCGALLGIRICS